VVTMVVALASAALVWLTTGNLPDFGPVVAALTAGVGLIAARDNDKSSEDVGADRASKAAAVYRSTAPLRVWMLAPLLLGLCGCAYVSSKTERATALPVPPALVGTNGVKPIVLHELTRTRGYSLFGSAQSIAGAKAHQGETKSGAVTQSAGFDGVEQTGADTNVARLFEAGMRGLASGLAGVPK